MERSQHFVAIDNRTHGAHTGNHTRTHRSMHIALYIALPFSWQLTLFRHSQAQHCNSSCNNNNSICQQQVVVSGFVAGFVWLWLSCLFCTGFVCFQHAYALLCIRIISTLHSRLATLLRDLHTRNLLLISSRCDLPATAFQLKQIRY